MNVYTNKSNNNSLSINANNSIANSIHSQILLKKKYKDILIDEKINKRKNDIEQKIEGWKRYKKNNLKIN